MDQYVKNNNCMTQLLNFEHMMIVLFKSWYSFNHKTPTNSHQIASLIFGMSSSIAIFLCLGLAYIIPDIKRDSDKRRCRSKSIYCTLLLFFFFFLLGYLKSDS